LDGLYFTRRNEWVRFFGRTAFVGTTGKELRGDVVYVELPKVGERVRGGEPCAKVESIKAEVDICSPVRGMVSAVNDSVYDDPDMIAAHPMSVWLFKVECDDDEDAAGLLTETEYQGI
jgi:glycine cleavage system H protein